MRFRLSPLVVVGALALAPTLLASNDARACGGCFIVPSTTESTVVTGHRMAFALSPTHTVLWDQIQYSGNPASFAWVLPVKAGARIEVSTDAWFEALEAATTARVVSPQISCSSGSSGCSLGCAASFADSAGGFTTQPPPVTVVHEGTVGPYETVTLHTTTPGALPTWLTGHGFAIDPSVQPVVDAYVKEGFDFIALRLQPGQGVQQMKPVRIITAGMSPTLPLRMVAAGTGANVDITLFVIGEGTWVPQTFLADRVNEGALIWDFDSNSSNYSLRRKQLMAHDGGRTWNEAFSIKGSLLGPLTSPVDGSTIAYTVGQASAQTIADAYIEQGILNGEGNDRSCEAAFQVNAASPLQVAANPCVPGGGSSAAGTGTSGAGGSSTGTGAGGASTSGGVGGASTSSGVGGASTSGGVGGASTSGGVGGASGGGVGGAAPVCIGEGQIDAKTFACDKLDDVAVALEGLHLQDVTVTRLEASLPRTALATDLVLQAAASQDSISNWFQVQESTGKSPCPSGILPVVGGDSGGKGPWNRNRWALTATLLAALAATFGRRATRPAGKLSRARS